MELTTLNVTLIGIFGSVVGVFFTAMINYLITYINRAKSYNEWRREKLLALIYDFLEQFKKDTRVNNKNAKDFDPSIIMEMALKSYSVSDNKAQQICLLINTKDGLEFINKYKALRMAKAKETESNFYIFASGNHYAYFEKEDNDIELSDLIGTLSRIIKSMR